jgi:ribose transport system substrate-binding protein
MGVDGLAIGPTDTAALTPYIDAAAKAGIKVVTFDSDAADSARLGYIGTDNVKAGRHMGEVLGKLLNGKGKVLVSMGVSTQQNLIQRLDGVKAVLAESYPEIQIIDEQSSQGDTSIALANIENMVTANPDFDALIGIDAAAGPAAVVAWKAQGLKKPVITFDDTDDIIQGVRDGQITVTIAQNQYVWGTTIVEELLSACQGAEVPVNFDTGTREVNADNVDEMYPED